jgi:hypothetical protein
MPYTSQSGQYGAIPYSELRQKYEVTAMGDNAKDSMSEHMRNSLRDMSCSATFFESDHKRDDNASETFLALRHTGHRTGETPDAPDLFLELTDRDPRGTALDPDFQKLRDQSWARADRHRFYSDSDHTITEREKMPHVIQRQLREQMEMTKHRLKIFSVSRDGQSTNLGRKKLGDRAETDDQTSITTREEILAAIRQQGQQQDPLALGWEQTGDSLFHVAALGQQRGAQKATDGLSTRAEVAASQKQADSVVQTIKTGAANLMRVIIDRINEGRRVEHHADQDASESLDTATGTSRFRGDERSRVSTTGLSTAAQREAFGTVQRFIGQLNSQSGMQGQDIETQLQVVQFMDNAITASRSSSEARFHAEDIVMAHKTGVSQEQDQKRVEQFCDPLARRNVGETRRYSESTAVAQLGTGRRHPSKEARFAKAGEGYKGVSRETVQKRLRSTLEDELSRAQGYDGTQYHHAFSTADRHVRGLGSKYTRERVDTERTLNAMADSS